MSIAAMNWAFKQPLAGNEKCVLLALADWARDDGVCWPGTRSVAEKAYVSEKTVKRILDRLEEAGYLTRERRTDANGHRAADLVRLAVLGDKVSPRPRGQMGGVLGDTHTRPCKNRQEPSALRLAPERDARVPVKYGGQKVPEPIVEAAEQVLGVFNEVTGRRLGARRSNGTPSEVLRQIIGAMIDRPSVTPQAWMAAVENTASNPPQWLNGGPLQPGHVFGAKAAEWALANDGKRVVSPDDEAKAAKRERQQKFRAAMDHFKKGGGGDDG